MPDGLDFSYSDPRFLRQKITSLEADIKKLKQQSMPLLAHQRGPLPGYLRAVAINDQGLKASMWANYTNIGPGSGPYQAVTDSNGVIRVELGNLAALGVSPAQQGFRTRDASGNPAFDSALGLIKGPAPVASNFITSTFTTSSTTPVLVTGSAVTIVPTNQVRVLVLYGASVSYGAPNTQTAFIDLFLDSVNQSAGGNGPALQLQYPTTTSGAVTSTGFLTAVLSAASHTIDLRASQNGTTSMTLIQGAVVVFQIGVV